MRTTVEKIAEIVKKWESGQVIQYEYKMVNYRRELINIRRNAKINLVSGYCLIEERTKFNKIVEQVDSLLEYCTLPVYERRGYIHLDKLINNLQNLYKKHKFDVEVSLLEPLMIINDNFESVYNFLCDCDTCMKYDLPPYYYLSRLTTILTDELFCIMSTLPELKLSKSRKAMWDNAIIELNTNAQILHYHLKMHIFTYWDKRKEILENKPTE